MNVDINLLKQKEEEIYAHLKDFQCATVEHVDHLFSNGKTRVLVADEVGLGKTLIARGTIIKQAIQNYNSGKRIFKVVYICSNQNIANQNISKLDFFNATDNYAKEARLSMQHLFIRESEERNRNKYIQLIPLTPDTSFRIGGSRVSKGIIKERALIFVILKRTGMFKEYLSELRKLLEGDVESQSFESERKNQRDRVFQCERNTDGQYPKDFIDHLLEYNKNSHELDNLYDYLKQIHEKQETSLTSTRMIGSLRVLFAKASITRFNPDLVILDEFQRFKYLLNSDECDPETKALIDLFFNSENQKVLMLSATPYKLYSTLDELDDPGSDGDHYSEFKQTIEFLLDDKNEYEKFTSIWSSYSTELREYANGLSATIEIKPKAENALYSVISRTERISVMDEGDYIDDTDTKNRLSINEDDIKSFLEIDEIIKQAGVSETRIVDYVKSCPYLLSYMNNYVAKTKINEYYQDHPQDIVELDKAELWVNYDDINHYKDIEITNARLSNLMEKVLSGGAEKYLWVPPSRPYYELRGPYINSKHFSKYMVFSAWEMVPRMISTLISYEVERRTLFEVASKNKREITYATETSRYLANRLRLDDKHMSVMSLLYPSTVLAKAYNPIRCLNQKETLDTIIKKTKNKIATMLLKLKKYENETSMANTDMWYYLAPVLLDYEENPSAFERATGSYEFYNYVMAFNKLYGYVDNRNNLKLGKMPEDLASVLAYEAIGSFGNCAYRANGKNKNEAIRLACRLMRYFNTPESAAVVLLSYQDDGENHWKNVLKYCVEGCLQSVLDEFFHIAADGIQDVSNSAKIRKANELMLSAFEYRTGSFRINVNPVRNNSEGKEDIGMRTHYAAGFRKTAGATNSESDVIHIDSIRNAFNSPFKPFVLATTSIGQEGLDFHQYCRKVVHWNLPSNPIDLEQREGRINRYKCLAIRQDIAERFCDLQIRNNVWNELFEMAIKKYKKPGQSELVPFWCLGSEQKVKIERIVPMYPFSKDVSKYERLIKILSLYRLTLGQARQEEVVEVFLRDKKDDEELKGLFMDLSPYSRVSEDWKKKFSDKHVISHKDDAEDAIKDIEKLSKIRNEITELEDKQLALEIQLEEMPSLQKGIKMEDKRGNIGELKEYNEETDWCSVNFGDEEDRSFQISIAMGKAIKIVDSHDLEIYNKRNELHKEIELISKTIDEKRETLNKLE